MFRFKVIEGNGAGVAASLESAYMVGTDRVPLRADLKLHRSQIVCANHPRGAAALAISWPVKGQGRLMMETTRLLERDEPYNLHLELARGQLMRIIQKREDWGLFDFAAGKPVYDRIDAARGMLIDGLTAADEKSAAKHGEAALSASVEAGEAMSLLHADFFLNRRRESGQMPKRGLGCRLDLAKVSEAHIQKLSEAFDFISLPMTWRMLEPQEGKSQVGAFDPLLKVLKQRQLPIAAHSLLCLDEASVPAWLAGQADTFERLREYVARHIRTVVGNLGAHVQAWEVIGGVHARDAFNLNFEQIMDLTRFAAQQVRQLAPRATTIMGVVLPWGEYYAKDARSIPPHLYAEMAVQSGVNFDAFGVDLRFATPPTHLPMRDLMQISSMLDRFGALGRPIHVTAGAPSGGGDSASGAWREEWNEEVQGAWLRDFHRIALSKPFVESITWQNLADVPGLAERTGVLRSDLGIKPAYMELLGLREQWLSNADSGAGI